MNSIYPTGPHQKQGAYTSLWDVNVISKYLLYAILLFTPLARGSVYSWHQGIIYIVALLMFSSLLIEKIYTGARLFERTSLDRPLILLLFLVVIASFFSVSRVDSIEAVALFLSYLVIFYKTVHICRSRSNQKELVYVLCGIATFPVIIAFLKAAGVDLFSCWVYSDLNNSANYFSGIFGNHNHLAGYLEMIIPLMIALFFTRTRRGLRKYALISWVILFLVCHILTLSRGGWFALVGALVFMGIILSTRNVMRKKALLIGVVTACCVFVFFVLSGSHLFDRVLSLAEEETLLGMDGRILIWKGTLQLIKEYIFLGTGPGTFAVIFPQFQPPGTMVRFYYAHNDYLHFFAELGILFIPVMCWLGYALFHRGFEKLGSRSRQVKHFSLGAMAGIVAMLLHSLVDFNLHIPANAIVFVVLIALVVVRPQKT